jgi:hypothetical protein
MSSEYESADLIIKLYELRREEKLRTAREWYARDFHPASAQDVLDTLRGEHSAYFRMVTSYWEQPLETHWQAYLDGKVSREAAIRQILIETTPAKN